MHTYLPKPPGISQSSYQIDEHQIPGHDAHGEICLEARVLCLSASLGQENLNFRNGHSEPLGKGVDGQGAEQVRHVLTVCNPNLFFSRI